MSSKRAAAHAAARRGFDVFPITPNAKKPPLFTGWQAKATQDPKQIDAWWDECPDANIGGTTDRFIVIDVDPRNGGKPTFECLTLVEDFEKTARSRTAGGGDHIIYAAPDGPVKSGTHKLGQGVDVKAGGGYIVLPGSTIDGNAYEWGNDRPIAKAMPWLLARCKESKPKPANAGKRLVEEDETAIELFTDWLRDRAPRAELGEIDDTTFKVATWGYDFGCTEATVYDKMLLWNDTHCKGLGDIERLAVVVESAGRNRDNPIGCKHPLAGFAAVEIDETKAPPPEPEKPKSRFYAVRADEGARRALLNPGEALIEGIIHCRTMSVLIGAPAGGKTFLVLDWAYHLAKGRPWGGRKVKQGAVVYLAAEAGNMIMSRLAALEAHYGPLGDAPLFIVPCSADFAHGAQDAKAMLALIQDVEKQCGQKVELFVVDTLARAISGGDENSSRDMGALIQSVDFIREQAKCHAMVIHHPGKDEGKGGRGHSSVLGGTDTEIRVANKVISFSKQRDMPLGPDIRFKLDTVVIGKDAAGKDVTSCVVRVAEAGKGEPQGDLTPRLRGIWDALDAALGDAGIASFDMAFLRKITFRHSSDTSPSRTTLIGWMSELSENGYLRKDQYGKWVRVTVGSVGFVGNQNGEVSEESSTLEEGAGPTHPDSKRIKRKR